MEENPHRVSRRNHGGTHFQNDAVDQESRRQRHYNGDEVKCSGKRCRSWAAAAIADCVALCCCPCAIINLLTLTFVKVPWMIGRRCLGRRNKKKKMKKKRRVSHRRGRINREEDHDEFHHHSRFEVAEEEKCGVRGGCCGGGDHYDDHRFVVERDGSLTKEVVEEKTTSFRVGGDDESRISARVEAERVWLELYQIGHLGFGRVSFTGIQ